MAFTHIRPNDIRFSSNERGAFHSLYRPRDESRKAPRTLLDNLIYNFNAIIYVVTLLKENTVDLPRSRGEKAGRGDRSGPR